MAMSHRPLARSTKPCRDPLLTIESSTPAAFEISALSFSKTFATTVVDPHSRTTSSPAADCALGTVAKEDISKTRATPAAKLFFVFIGATLETQGDVFMTHRKRPVGPRIRVTPVAQASRRRLACPVKELVRAKTMSVKEIIQDATSSLIDADRMAGMLPPEQQPVIRALISSLVGIGQAIAESHRELTVRIGAETPQIPITRAHCPPLAAGME